MGKASDEETARRLHRTLQSVKVRRSRLGLPRVAPARRDWTVAEEAILGTAPDDAVARRLGRSPKAVGGRRKALGIAQFRDGGRLKRKPWRLEDDAVLGTVSDERPHACWAAAPRAQENAGAGSAGACRTLSGRPGARRSAHCQARCPMRNWPGVRAACSKRSGAGAGHWESPVVSRSAASGLAKKRPCWGSSLTKPSPPGWAARRERFAPAAGSTGCAIPPRASLGLRQRINCWVRRRMQKSRAGSACPRFR